MKYDRKIRPKKKNRKKKLLSLILIIVAILYVIPIIFTICNSFMAESEIAANYGKIFESVTGKGSSRYISETVHLKFIPDMVSFKQYFTVLFNSPDYLLKFWNSVILVIPIVIFQMGVALLASYGFARYRGRLREIIFFAYIILMLMPYQVTLVPNFFVSEWLGIIDSNWAIWLPGIFSPFAVFLLTKCMRRIPVGIIEAAKIDGAGEFKIFTQICIPLCKSAIASVCILLFIDYWNMVEQPLVLLSDSDMHPLSVFLSKINQGEIGIAFAVATIYMIPTLLVFQYGEEYLVEGITYQGGMKG
ncbi:MAG: carbohydrate ABC transporter permease [Lachnospiraceae bacterium]|nr:carbohydrate ABC transporter permease [Lachnospiraceae bacterium]